MDVLPPACFRSLQPTEDPVSLYERSNIQQWLQDQQQLSCRDLIPNHTLQRLMNECDYKIPERVSMMGGIGKSELVERLIAQVKAGARADRLIDMLREMRLLARESARNSRVIAESEDAVVMLAAILSSRSKRIERCCREEALGILTLIPMSACKRSMLGSHKSFIAAVCGVLRGGSCVEARTNAAALLESVVGSERDLKIAAGNAEDGFPGLVELVRNNDSSMAVKAGLRTLMALCSPRRNRIKAVESGAAEALIEILPKIKDRSTCENALAVLEMLCRCAEGRLAVCEVGAGIAAIARKIMTVSDVATEYAVRTLWAICKHSADAEGIQRRVVEAGVVSKLLLMLQMDFSSSTKHEMSDLLKLLCNIQQHCPDVMLQDRIHLDS